MEGVKDLHRPCACYGITQCVIRVDILMTNTLLYFVRKIGVFFKLIDRYNKRVGFVLHIHGLENRRELLELYRFPDYDSGGHNRCKHT